MAPNSARQIALGGMLAALAMVIFTLGGMIPIATFVCPMFTMLILRLICRLCGKRIGWAWYGCVALLALLLSPDKESAAVFLCMGYYPIIKIRLDRTRPSWLWKALFFNGVILLMYQVLIHLFGMQYLADEYAQLGMVLTVAMLLLGNLCFFMLDHVLSGRMKRRRRG